MEFQDTMPLGDTAPPPRRDAAPAAPTPPVIAPAPATRTGPQGLAIEFTGTGSEYFRIWIVNLLLTIVTLGFYYPFAKARRLRYFHGNTLVGGHALGFHGDPWKMLRGFVLMLVFGGAYAGAGHFSPIAGAVAAVAFALLWPALWQSSLRFRLANTSWRGLRLRFSGSLGGAYAALLPLLLPVAVIVAAGALSQRDEPASRAVGANAGAIAEAAERLAAPAAGESGGASGNPSGGVTDNPSDSASGSAPRRAAAPAGADAAEDKDAADAEEEAADGDKPEPVTPTGPADYVIIAMSFVLLLMMPWLLARLKRYQHGHYQFANETSRLEAPTRSFYALMLRTIGVSLIPVAMIGGAFALLFGAFKGGGGGAALAGASVLAGLLIFVAYLLLLVLTQSYMTARSQNLVWGTTRSHRLRFASRLKVRSMLGLMLTNLLLTVITFGLYRPFAAIATAKLRLEAVSLEAHGDVEQWTAGAARRVNDATGDAAGDLFGIDVGL
jgi:uncharacterized membrane protein YjgN (DUF898 family)